jgi:hypothetical protein
MARSRNQFAAKTTIHCLCVCVCVCVCVIELHVTVNFIKILGVAQQCFYGTFFLFARKELQPVFHQTVCHGVFTVFYGLEQFYGTFMSPATMQIRCTSF